MRILSWNVRFQGLRKRLNQVVEAIASEEPDIVLLQEVALADLETMVAALDSVDLKHAVDSHTDAPPRPTEYAKKRERKLYAVVTASRFPVTRASDKWRKQAPYPEVLLRASVAPKGGPSIDTFNVHIPNGSGNGWRKISTLEFLHSALIGGADEPRLLAGDFNEPKYFRTSGQIVSWGPRVRADHSLKESSKPWTDLFGEARPGRDWNRGVMQVLAGAAHHGLQDAYRAIHGFDDVPVTHVTTGGGKRCFDHAFASRHFEIKSCRYRHDWRSPMKLSDHSALILDVEPRDVGPLMQWQVSEDIEDAEDGAEES